MPGGGATFALDARCRGSLGGEEEVFIDRGRIVAVEPDVAGTVTAGAF